MPRLLALAALALAATPAAAAPLVGTPVAGSLRFGADPTNYFDPANGAVPDGFLNSPPGTATVIVSAADAEFGFADGPVRASADFSDAGLTIAVLTPRAANLPAATYRFTDPAFALLAAVETSDTFANGGATFALSGDTLTVNTPAFATEGGTPQVVTLAFAGPPPTADSAVPEPAALATLALAGASGLGYVRRRMTGAPAAA